MDESKTPPTHLGSCRYLTLYRGGFGFVHHSIATLYHEVPILSITIRNFFIAVHLRLRRLALRRRERRWVHQHAHEVRLRHQHLHKPRRTPLVLRSGRRYLYIRWTPTAPHCLLIPTVTGHTVRSFSTHGQQSAAQGSSTSVSGSDIRLIQYLDSSADGLVRRGALLIGYFPIHLLPRRSNDTVLSIHWRPEYTTRFPVYATLTHARTHIRTHCGSPLQVRTRSSHLQVRAR
jgi:hypothetical protein